MMEKAQQQQRLHPCEQEVERCDAGFQMASLLCHLYSVWDSNPWYSAASFEGGFPPELKLSRMWFTEKLGGVSG